MPPLNAPSTATASTLSVVNPYAYLDDATQQKSYDILAVAALCAMIGALLIKRAAVVRTVRAAVRPFTTRPQRK